MKKIPGRTYVRIGHTVIAISDTQVNDLKRMAKNADKSRKKKGQPHRNISQESVAQKTGDDVQRLSPQDEQIPLGFEKPGDD